MKTKSLVAACLAGVGLYLVVTSSMTVIFALTMLASDHRGIGAELVLCMPFFCGVLFVVFASRFASLICRVAKAEEDFTAIIQPQVAILVACVVTGLLVVITQLPELVQLCVKQFLAAASPTYAAAHQYEDYKLLMVQSGVYTLLAIILVWKSRVIARWLVARYEKS